MTDDELPGTVAIAPDLGIAPDQKASASDFNSPANPASPGGKQGGDTPGETLTFLDVLAFLVGAAVMATYLTAFPRQWTPVGWVFVVSLMTLVALTASGPALLIIRRIARPGWPRAGPYEWLWAMLGLPWVALSLRVGDDRALDIIHCAQAMVPAYVLWILLVLVRAFPAGRGPWTNRFGRVIAIAWPLWLFVIVLAINSPL